jgi:hypothetical protein
MNVREARLEDARAIAEVHLASWKTTYRGIIAQEYIDGLRVEEGMARLEGAVGTGVEWNEEAVSRYAA